MPGKFELNGTGGSFGFNLKAANGQVILTSQRYRSKAAAIKGIASVARNSSNPDNYSRKTAKDGRSYFVLEARNGQVIGNSQMYTTTGGRDNGIRSVMKNASDAAVVDLS